MKQNLTVVITNETNPYHNIALEEYLLHAVGEQECILYLWQNRNTVVIGRNQHAENECRVQDLQRDGGFLARRLSGGGAVYHDLGNLNFTFLAYEDHFDISSQNEVILRAVKRLGVQAEKNGRNDLTVDGKKFSGHAYYKTGGRCYHHGTLMVDVDHTRLAAYLNVSPLKLNAKGVRSVRSRVANLVDFNPDITIKALQNALIDTFSEVYGQPVQIKTDNDLQDAPIRIEAFSSEQWIMGNCAPLEHSREARFGVVSFK